MFEDDEFIVTWWWRTSDDQNQWYRHDETYFPMSETPGDKGLVGQGWGRSVRLYPPSSSDELDKKGRLSDYSVNIHKKIKGMGKTMTLPFSEYGLQIDFVKSMFYETWENGKVVTSAKA